MKEKIKRDQTFEIDLYFKDHDLICGIDEVGRGPIAGPVVSCAVIMPKSSHIEGVCDSKKISDKKRRILSESIKDEALAIGYGVVDNRTIDEINIREATLLSMRLAVDGLKDKEGNGLRPDLLLVDAETIDSEIDQLSVVGGDDRVYQISASSILAKVYRDDLMIEYSKTYSQYLFERHKGYGTKAHYQAITDHGTCPIHRQSFLKKYYERQEEINRTNGGKDS